MVTLDTADPLTLLGLVIMGGIVLAGVFFFAREIIAEAILLADRKREWRDHDRKRDRGGHS
jgi:hypothetical protein